MQNIFRVLVCLDLCAAGAEFSRHLDHTRGQTCCMYSSGKKPLPNSEQGVKRKLLSTNHLGTIQASHEQEHCMAIPCKTNASFLFDKSETPKFDPEYRNGQTPRPPTPPPPDPLLIIQVRLVWSFGCLGDVRHGKETVAALVERSFCVSLALSRDFKAQA